MTAPMTVDPWLPFREAIREFVRRETGQAAGGIEIVSFDRRPDSDTMKLQDSVKIESGGLHADRVEEYEDPSWDHSGGCYVSEFD